MSTAVLLAATFLFQNVAPEDTSTPISRVAQPPKLKTLPPLMWEEHVPFVGCEHGRPILNVTVPDEGAPPAICPGIQAPDVLPKLSAKSTSPDSDYEVGTIIVVSVSHAKIVVAADSRNTLVTQHTLANGTVETKLKYDDCACKLTQLTPTILFAADGITRTSTATIPATVLYDAHKLAKLAARNYRHNGQEEQLAGGRIAAIATRWAWDVDFRMHQGFANGWKPIGGQTLEGIFAGLEPNGETSIAIAKLEYPNRQSGLHVPPATFTVGTLQLTPKGYTWISAYGMNAVAETYYNARAMTAQTKEENKKIGAEMTGPPASFSTKLPEHLVDLTIQQYKASAGPQGTLLVHEPIDVAVIERGKRIHWIHWKKCSGMQIAQPHAHNKTAG